MKKRQRGSQDNTITGRIYRSTSLLTIGILSVYLLIILSCASLFFYKNAIRSASQNAEVIANSFSLYTEELEYKMLVTILNDGVQQNITAYHEGKQDFQTTRINVIDTVTELLGTMTNASGGDIVLDDGKIIGGSEYFVNLPAHFYEDLQKEKDYEPFSWMGPYELLDNRYNMGRTFVVQKRILDPYRYHQMGMLYVCVDEENIRDAFLGSNHDSGIRYLLADREGQAVLCGTGENSETLSDLRIGSREKWKFISHELCYLAQVPLQNAGMILVAIVPFTDLFSSLLLFTMVLLISAAVTIFFSLLFCRRTSEEIAQPISALARTMEAATQGNRKLRVENAPENEFEILSNSFNNLMDANEALISGINEKHRKLRYYEFSIFQQQIKPHFLYNALSNISALIKLDMKEEAINTVENLSRFFRISLTGTDGIIRIREELDLVERYFSIQKLRFQDRITLQGEVEPKILDQKIPKLTLQPLIENCIHHAVSQKTRNIRIMVRGYRQGDVVVLEVEDNGGGILPEQLQEILRNINDDNNKNFGLTAVNQRLKLIYGDQYKLDIQSKVGAFTRVTVKVPHTEEGGIKNV